MHTDHELMFVDTLKMHFRAEVAPDRFPIAQNAYLPVALLAENGG